MYLFTFNLLRKEMFDTFIKFYNYNNNIYYVFQTEVRNFNLYNFYNKIL